MKIEKVIFTIDDNPHYMGFWSSISNHYKNRLNIQSKLFVIGDNPDISKYDTSNGEVEFVKSIDNVPTIIQALIGKFYFTINEPETTWLIGDLDLYPLQQYHFKDRIIDIDENKYVHLNPHAYGVNWRNNFQGLAGYFHVAKGKTFLKELNFVNKSFEDVVKEIYNSDKWGIKFYNLSASNESVAASNDYGWFCCEEMYTGSLLKNSKNFIELPPIDGYRRVDRSDMVYDETKIKEGFYIDFHSVRPYEKYSVTIESIVKNIPK